MALEEGDWVRVSDAYPDKSLAGREGTVISYYPVEAEVYVDFDDHKKAVNYSYVHKTGESGLKHASRPVRCASCGRRVEAGRNDWKAKIYFGGMSQTEPPYTREFGSLGEAERWVRDEFENPSVPAPYEDATINGPGGEEYVLQREGEAGMAEVEVVYELKARENHRDVLERSREIPRIKQFERKPDGTYTVVHEFKPDPPVEWGIKLPYERLKERLLDIYPRGVEIEMIDMFPEEKVDPPLEMTRTS